MARKWTYEQYWADVTTSAKALIELGLDQHRSVGKTLFLEVVFNKVQSRSVALCFTPASPGGYSGSQLARVVFFFSGSRACWRRGENIIMLNSHKLKFKIR